MVFCHSGEKAQAGPTQEIGRAWEEWSPHCPEVAVSRSPVQAACYLQEKKKKAVSESRLCLGVPAVLPLESPPRRLRASRGRSPLLREHTSSWLGRERVRQGNFIDIP